MTAATFQALISGKWQGIALKGRAVCEGIVRRYGYCPPKPKLAIPPLPGSTRKQMSGHL